VGGREWGGGVVVWNARWGRAWVWAEPGTGGMRVL